VERKWTESGGNAKIEARNILDLWKFRSWQKWLEDRQTKGQRLISTMPKHIHQGAQDKHIPGKNNYIKGRSIVYPTVDVQDLVNRYSGKGFARLRTNHDETVNKVLEEIRNSDTVVGVAISIDGIYNTHDFKIHYSKKGTHIVPYHEEE
jgi:hypothetical protein